MLKKINDKLYIYINKENNVIFTLERQRIGVYSNGRCHTLVMHMNGSDIIIATFVTSDDGHQCYNNYCESRLWTEDEIIPEADRMIKAILR